jgi:hypothetical protein
VRLTFKPCGSGANYMPVTDKDTGEEVGYIQLANSGLIKISLFDGNYQTTVHNYKAALGFVMGVEAVLNSHDFV